MIIPATPVENSNRVESGLIGCWPLDESAGYHMDYSGYANHATTSAARWIARYGYRHSMSPFFNSGPTLEFGNKCSRAGTLPFSVTGWFYVSWYHSNVQVIVGRGSTYNNSREFMVFANGADKTLNFQRADGSSFPTVSTSANFITLGTPYHFCATFSGTEMGFTVNGTSITPVATSISVTNADRLTIGGLYDATGGALPIFKFTGGVSNIKIYSRVLTRSEILKDYFSTAMPDDYEEDLYVFNSNVFKPFWASNSNRIIQ